MFGGKEWSYRSYFSWAHFHAAVWE